MEFTNDKANGCEAMCVSIYGIEQNAVQLGLVNIDKKKKFIQISISLVLFP